MWNNQTGASGGGVSSKFARPAWQRDSRVPHTAKGFQGRGVPDVAANADPLTGYRVFLGGKWGVGAGTSAAAPLWAGLVARINQGRGAPVGLLTPFMYEQYERLRQSGAIVPVTKGSDGLYRARHGWDCCTGLGTPRGEILHRAFESAARKTSARREDLSARRSFDRLHVRARDTGRGQTTARIAPHRRQRLGDPRWADDVDANAARCVERRGASEAFERRVDETHGGAARGGLRERARRS